MGTKYTMEELVESTSRRFKVGISWHDIRHAPVAPCRSRSFPRETIDLVRVTPRELGITGEQELSAIFAAALAQGLVPCPLEAAFQLRCQYGLQPDNERLIMAMVSGRVFVICNDTEGESGMQVTDYYNDMIWSDSSEWLFVRPRA